MMEAETLPAITEEQVAAYAANPAACPFCRSSNITGAAVEIDSGAAYQTVTCEDCARVWDDGYTLDRILDRTEDDFRYFPRTISADVEAVLELMAGDKQNDWTDEIAVLRAALS